MEKRWYVVHTYSGYENKVKANLEKRVESMGMEDKIFRVLVPMEEEIVNKDGKKKPLCVRFTPDMFWWKWFRLMIMVCCPQYSGRYWICWFDRLRV